jgi:hypothetical protein
MSRRAPFDGSGLQLILMDIGFIGRDIRTLSCPVRASSGPPGQTTPAAAFGARPAGRTEMFNCQGVTLQGDARAIKGRASAGKAEVKGQGAGAKKRTGRAFRRRRIEGAQPFVFAFALRPFTSAFRPRL